MHYVYILQNGNGRCYVGYSHDLKRRLSEHQFGNVSTTKVFKNAKLAWYCAFASKRKALGFEKYLKEGSGHAFARKRLI
ncbi:MAG: GIY-YIG nuclease family protein [Patescibacteria group bacterium]|nr:GIY-YIG nuclease family protein [Patescibacteria group bacterium]